MGDFVFFWGIGDVKTVQKGCLSQWWPCSFEIDGVRYNCAEQYMMAEKARTFGDGETLEKILASDKPRVIKNLGREVRGFDPAKWDAVKYGIVVKGNTAKFSQDSKLKEFLLSTGGAELVEASPVDEIWGIGLAEGDSGIRDKANWKGQNLLGKALMDARAVIS